ncbi:uncharacterized protein LOC129602295 [Paramacrobiotus metropolitanus]|uniref:uncharacterized protein LOC129602295 n=1 Tax=Paramacrobiotus metropolitanus TaxID=2943436 RepID=UPI0024462B0A|nr:uncharacterized protein LOC129602295 [Paramacrobiotus metropolitanus]
MSAFTLMLTFALSLAVVAAKEQRITAVWLSRDFDAGRSINHATVHAALRDANDLLVDSQTAMTNAFGEFNLSIPVETIHTITFEMAGFSPIVLANFHRNLRLNSTVIMEPLLWISETWAGPATVSGRLFYMSPGNYNVAIPAPSVNVTFRYGLNNDSGPFLATTTTMENGYWVQSLPSGYYTATASATGYIPKVFTVVVYSLVGPAPMHSLMPDVSNDDIRIILFNSRYAYMELVVEGPLQDTQYRTRVECQGMKSSEDKLIQNDYAGTFADSTVITKQLPGTYRISVYDWNSRKKQQISLLANSNSVVELYRGKSLWARYYVPNRVGNTWSVAEFNGANLTVINEITTEYHYT